MSENETLIGSIEPDIMKRLVQRESDISLGGNTKPPRPWLASPAVVEGDGVAATAGGQVICFG